MLLPILAAAVGWLSWREISETRALRDAQHLLGSTAKSARQSAPPAQAGGSAPEMPSELSDLREEIARLETEILRRERIEAARMPVPRRPIENAESSGPWRDAGQASPETSFESILWAVSRGNQEALARLIEFDEAGGAEAKAFLESLPPDLRAEFGDEKQLIAAMLASRIPAHLDTADVVALDLAAPDQARMTVRIAGKARRASDVVFRMRHAPDGWRLIVPTPIIEGFRYNVTGVSVEGTPAPRQ